MTALFSFAAVVIDRGSTRVLDHLTVSIPDQGITAVIGASGSDKSTLLRCCNLLESPTSGHITFRGADLSAVEPRAHRRKVAMVFQTPIVFPGTALDNLRAADQDLDAEAAGALFEQVGLPLKVLTRGADTLSGGEAQRLCLARSLVQMGIVAMALVPIVKPETPLVWSWLWVAIIVVFASVTVARRTPEVPGLLVTSLIAHVVVAVISLVVVFGLGIFDLSGRSLVPVSGMVIGGAMKAAIVAARRITDAATEHRAEIEAGLALGISVSEATRRQVRSGLRTAITPQLEQVAGLGIVFLPGAMTGLILAGAEPFEAVRTQLALMYVMLAAVIMAAVITGLGTLRGLTTRQQTLVRLIRS